MPPRLRRTRSHRLLALGLPLVVTTLLIGCEREPARPGTFVRERGAHRTQLVRKGPAPAVGSSLEPFEWLEVFEFQSGSLPLRGFRAFPTERRLERGGRVPGLLYLHGGFALARQDVLDVLGFLRSGFAVYAPALRGENGNPGYHELFYGELDDARAALEALRQDPRVDPHRLFVLGHSAGGVLASLLTLQPDLGLPETASIGGIYQGQVFDFLDRPFQDDENERRLRLFLPHMRQMSSGHWACVGRKDPAYDATVLARSVADRAKLPFQLHEVPGDHVSALPGCVRAYLERALSSLESSPPLAGPPPPAPRKPD